MHMVQEKPLPVTLQIQMGLSLFMERPLHQFRFRGEERTMVGSRFPTPSLIQRIPRVDLANGFQKLVSKELRVVSPVRVGIVFMITGTSMMGREIVIDMMRMASFYVPKRPTSHGAIEPVRQGQNKVKPLLQAMLLGCSLASEASLVFCSPRRIWMHRVAWE